MSEPTDLDEMDIQALYGAVRAYLVSTEHALGELLTLERADSVKRELRGVRRDVRNALEALRVTRLLRSRP